MVVDTLTVRMVAESREYIRDTREAAASTREAAAAVRDMAAAGSGVGALAGGVGGLAGSLRGLVSLSAAGAGLGAGFAAASAAVDVLRGGVSAAVGMTRDLVESTARLGVEYQASRIEFEGLTRSAETGKKLMKDLQNFAVNSPFGTRGLADMSSMLLGGGFEADEVLPVLQRLGDITQGNEGKLRQMVYAFQQVKGMGRLMGGEMIQLSNAGLSVAELAEGLGVTTDKLYQLRDAGRLTYNDLVRAVNALTSAGGRFHGLTENGQRSVKGQLASLQETWDTFRGRLGENLLERFDVAGNMRAFVDRLQKELEAAGPGVEQWVGRVGAEVGKVFDVKTVDDFVVKAGGWGKEFRESLPAVEKVFATAKETAVSLAGLVKDLKTLYALAAPAAAGGVDPNAPRDKFDVTGFFDPNDVGPEGGSSFDRSLSQSLHRIVRAPFKAATWFGRAVGKAAGVDQTIPNMLDRHELEAARARGDLLTPAQVNERAARLPGESPAAARARINDPVAGVPGFGIGPTPPRPPAAPAPPAAPTSPPTPAPAAGTGAPPAPQPPAPPPTPGPPSSTPSVPVPPPAPPPAPPVEQAGPPVPHDLQVRRAADEEYRLTTRADDLGRAAAAARRGVAEVVRGRAADPNVGVPAHVMNALAEARKERDLTADGRFGRRPRENAEAALARAEEARVRAADTFLTAARTRVTEAEAEAAQAQQAADRAKAKVDLLTVPPVSPTAPPARPTTGPEAAPPPRPVPPMPGVTPETPPVPGPPEVRAREASVRESLQAAERISAAADRFLDAANETLRAARADAEFKEQTAAYFRRQAEARPGDGGARDRAAAAEMEAAAARRRVERAETDQSRGQDESFRAHRRAEAERDRAGRTGALPPTPPPSPAPQPVPPTGPAPAPGPPARLGGFPGLSQVGPPAPMLDKRTTPAPTPPAPPAGATPAPKPETAPEPKKVGPPTPPDPSALGALGGAAAAVAPTPKPPPVPGETPQKPTPPLRYDFKPFSRGAEELAAALQKQREEGGLTQFDKFMSEFRNLTDATQAKEQWTPQPDGTRKYEYAAPKIDRATPEGQRIYEVQAGRTLQGIRQAVEAATPAFGVQANARGSVEAQSAVNQANAADNGRKLDDIKVLVERFVQIADQDEKNSKRAADALESLPEDLRKKVGLAIVKKPVHGGG